MKASRKHFAPYVNGLFEDPRAVVIPEDGRNHLLGSGETYDVIVADLFNPWKAGTGGLYTREHYRVARDRLAPGGLYAQWLPLFQLSQDEFGIIARTMLEVFPQVTFWRGNFRAGKPIALLVGRTDDAPLDPASPDMVANASTTL